MSGSIFNNNIRTRQAQPGLHQQQNQQPRMFSMFGRQGQNVNTNNHRHPAQMHQGHQATQMPGHAGFLQHPQHNTMPNQAHPRRHQNMPMQPQARAPAQPQRRQSGSNLPRLNPNLQENPFEAKLPDGVKLVPLDENSMRNIHQAGAQQKQAAPPDTHQASAPNPSPIQNPAPNFEAVPIQPQNHGERLRAFIQNERNGHIFYANLAESAPSQELKTHLSNISSNCAQRRTKLTEAHTQHIGEAFTPREAQIGAASSFGAGLRMAITQEGINAAELSRLYETTDSPELARQLNAQIHSKLLDISLLNMMLYSS